MMIYQWREGFHCRVKAAVAVPHLFALRRRNGGKLPASIVVQDARSKKSPTHDAFPWNDKEAAHEHRLQIARTMIRACAAIPDDAPDDTEPTACFVAVDRGDDEMDYTPTNLVLQEMATDPETREQMLNRAIRDAQSFRRSYQHLLPELSELFDAIERLQMVAAS